MSTVPEHPDLFSSFRKVSDILTNPISPMKVHDIINPRRACAARVTVLGLCVCLCVCYSTSHFSHDCSCHK